MYIIQQSTSINHYVKTLNIYLEYLIFFETWYKEGYWGDGYITYSLINNNTVVSNASVSIMDFLILGEKKRYIQIGTVMTDIEYRGQGLNSFLINRIIEEWEFKCDLIYLFETNKLRFPILSHA